MQIDLLLARIFSSPVAVAEGYLAVLTERLGDRSNVLSFADELSDEAKEQALVYTHRRDGGSLKESREGSILVMTIPGPMVHRRMGSAASGGPTAYSDAMAVLDRAEDDASISGVVMELDSPGGEVSGMFELADRVHGYSKPIYAVANTYATSAAYVIGRAARKFFASQSAILGSIGVVAIHADESKKNEASGVKYTIVRSRSKKFLTSSLEPLSEEGLTGIERTVKSADTMMMQKLSKYSGLAQKTFSELDGQVYDAKEALRLGLVDGIMGLDGVIREIAQAPRSKRVSATEEQTKMEKEGTQQQAAETPVEQPKQQASQQAPSANTAKEILTLCTLAGCPEKALAFIEANKTVAQVQAELLAARAAGQESVRTATSKTEAPKIDGAKLLMDACDRIAQRMAK